MGEFTRADKLRLIVQVQNKGREVMKLAHNPIKFVPEMTDDYTSVKKPYKKHRKDDD